MKGKNSLSSVFSFCLGFVIVFVLMHCVLFHAYVPSQSMVPTIEIGDHLLGYRLFQKINRRDIIIFHDPDGSGKYLVKRVIGMPGETVSIHDGNVYINGSLLEEDYVENKCSEDEVFEYTVDADSYFVMGDNRTESYDARYWKNKKVTDDDIVGVVFCRIWPWR